MLQEEAVVLGAYESWAPMEQATIMLKNEGIKNKDIEFSCDNAFNDLKEKGEDEVEGRSVAGAIAGITLGVALAFVSGIILIRNTNSMVLVAAVPILIIIVASIVGEFLGSLSDAFSRVQMERSNARGIRSLVRGGKVLLTVHCHNLAAVKKIKDILKATGAQNISLNEHLEFSSR